MRETNAASPATLARRIGASYRETLPPLIRHPATWLYVALFALAAGVLAMQGHGRDIARDGGNAASALILVAITIPVGLLSQWLNTP